MRDKIVLSIFAFGTMCYGGAIATQSDLVTIMGGVGTVENFSVFSVASGTAAGLTCTVLNSSSVCNGQGPGLVVSGVQFGFGTGGGQWDGIGYDGATSEEILSGDPEGQPLTITFSTPVTAFGLDIRALPGWPATATVTIFGTDDTTILGTISGVSLLTSGASVFEGWEDLAGIGEVELTQSGQAWSPVLDFLEFGNVDPPAPAPEPSSAILVGLGAGAFLLRRRGSRGRRDVDAGLWKSRAV